MNLLLDTCAFLWLACQPQKLSTAAKAALNDVASELYISDASLWEIALKHRTGKLPLPGSPRLWIPKQISFFQLRAVPIDASDILLSGELPGDHPDPFDQLIAAQALNRQMVIVTSDKPFRTLGAPTVW